MEETRKMFRAQSLSTGVFTLPDRSYKFLFTIGFDYTPFYKYTISYSYKILKSIPSWVV